MFVREAGSSLMFVAFVLKVLFLVFCHFIPLSLTSLLLLSLTYSYFALQRLFVDFS